MKQRLSYALIILSLSAPLQVVCASGNGDKNQTVNSSSSASESYASGSVDNKISTEIQQIFEASEPTAPMPLSVTAPVISPNMFGTSGTTAQVAGMPILAKDLFIQDVHDISTGRSRGTKIIYNGTKLPLRRWFNDRKIFFNFSGEAYGEIAGSITIQSKKNKTDEVDTSTLLYDVRQYIKSRTDLDGYTITLLTNPQILSCGLGVDSKSSGLALSPVVSGLVKGPAGIVAGLSSSIANAGGITIPASIVGGTFLVVVDGNNPQAITLVDSPQQNNPVSGKIPDTPPQSTTIETASSAHAAETSFIVQFGNFSKKEHAELLAEQLKTYEDSVVIAENNRYKVVLRRRFNSKKEAINHAERLPFTSYIVPVRT